MFSEVFWSLRKKFSPQVAIASENGLNLALIELVDGNPLKFYFGITLTPLKFWKFVDGIRILIFFLFEESLLKALKFQKAGIIGLPAKLRERRRQPPGILRS